MPIRKRISDQPRRTDPWLKAKGRHPLLKNGSPHLSVWDVLCDAGRRGLTAAGIKSKTTYYHPQVMKDLLDAKLADKLGKIGNEWYYTADPKARGIVPTEVRVKVELLEDEHGYFHAKAYVIGSTQQPKGGVRLLKDRTVSFVIPLVEDLTDPTFHKAHKIVTNTQIEGEAVEVITDPSRMIIDQ